MDGSEKLPVFIICKSASARCSKRKKQLPDKYITNHKARMTREEIFFKMAL